MLPDAFAADPERLARFEREGLFVPFALRVYSSRQWVMRRAAVLLVERDRERRSLLSHALRAEGMPVLAVAGIAEVERWPAGDVVVTESRRFTTLWKETGAAHVVVLADTDEEGMEACVRGACAWIPRDAHADALIGVLQELGVLEPAVSAGCDAE